MQQILMLSENERADLFNEAGTRLGLSPFYVEKDFWVCWTLNILFGNRAFSPYLTFRGGTSLSKGWSLIQRFSEDIDLAISRKWFALNVADLGEQGLNTAKRDRREKELRRACR